MTQANAEALLKSAGAMKPFKPYLEGETGALLLKTRKTAIIIDGQLVGSEIAYDRAGMFRVWTPRKKLASRIARSRGLRLRLFESEAELFVPASMADELLPPLGARVTRQLSPEVAQRARERLQRARATATASKVTPISSNFVPRAAQEGASGELPVRMMPGQGDA